jgi:hypothetical protein
LLVVCKTIADFSRRMRSVRLLMCWRAGAGSGICGINGSHRLWYEISYRCATSRSPIYRPISCGDSRSRACGRGASATSTRTRRSVACRRAAVPAGISFSGPVDGTRLRHSGSRQILAASSWSGTAGFSTFPATGTELSTSLGESRMRRDSFLRGNSRLTRALRVRPWPRLASRICHQSVLSYPAARSYKRLTLRIGNNPSVGGL